MSMTKTFHTVEEFAKQYPREAAELHAWTVERLSALKQEVYARAGMADSPLGQTARSLLRGDGCQPKETVA